MRPNNFWRTDQSPQFRNRDTDIRPRHQQGPAFVARAISQARRLPLSPIVQLEFRVPRLEMRVLHLEIDIEDVHQRAFRVPERESRILQPDISLHLIALGSY